MTRFHFQRPDGPASSNVQNPSTILNQFIPPQGFPVTGAEAAINWVDGANNMVNGANNLVFKAVA